VPIPPRRPADLLALGATLLALAACTGGSAVGSDAGSGPPPVQDTGPSPDTGGEGEVEYPGTNQCFERCDEDGDCLQGYRCTEHRCWLDGSLDCINDTDCVAVHSGWVTPCDGADHCPDQACITFGVRGRCATRADIIPCETLDLDTVDRREHGGGALVQICAKLGAYCGFDGKCAQKPCETDEDCIAAAYPSCNLDTGRCVCTPTSCTYNASECIAGTCRCTRDEDCSGGPHDACIDGVCGCSSVDVCPADTVHLHTTPICAPRFIPGGARLPPD